MRKDVFPLYMFITLNLCVTLTFREGIKKTRFLGRSFPNVLTHPPQGFVRFGKTKGEICVEKGDFWGDLGGKNVPF